MSYISMWCRQFVKKMYEMRKMKEINLCSFNSVSCVLDDRCYVCASLKAKKKHDGTKPGSSQGLNGVKIKYLTFIGGFFHLSVFSSERLQGGSGTETLYCV